MLLGNSSLKKSLFYRALGICKKSVAWFSGQQNAVVGLKGFFCFVSCTGVE